MKNSILPFLLGVAITMCLGAGAIASDIVMFRPAPSKNLIVIEATWGNTKANLIKEYYQKGYAVTKTVSIDTKALIIMEKY